LNVGGEIKKFNHLVREKKQNLGGERYIIGRGKKNRVFKRKSERAKFRKGHQGIGGVRQEEQEGKTIEDLRRGSIQLPKKGGFVGKLGRSVKKMNEQRAGGAKYFQGRNERKAQSLIGKPELSLLRTNWGVKKPRGLGE